MKPVLHLIQISVVLFFLSGSVLAQSADDLKLSYGPPVSVFEIRPGIMMNVRFDKSGQASELRIQRYAVTDSTVYLDTGIPPSVSNEIIDELVPVAERGVKGKFSGLMLIVGGVGTSTDDYENVAITYYTSQAKECGGLLAILIKWKHRAL